MYIVDMVPLALRLEKKWSWRVVALSDSSGPEECSTYQYLKGLSVEDRDGLLKVFSMACETGPSQLPRANRHEMDSDNGIFEFIKGRHRIAWFYDSGKLVVCTAGFFKKTQETPTKQKKAALKAMKNYMAAKDDGSLKDSTSR
jgi:hypothetical protein